MNVFSAIPDMPLIEYVAGSFAFAFLFYGIYRIIGVVK